jgi:hypothetical protein
VPVREPAVSSSWADPRLDLLIERVIGGPLAGGGRSGGRRP